MFSLLARHRPQPVLTALSRASRALSDSALLPRSVYLRVRRDDQPTALKYSDVKSELSAHGPISHFQIVTPKEDSQAFFAAFESEEVAKKLLEAKSIPLAGTTVTVVPSRGLPKSQYSGKPDPKRPSADSASVNVTLLRLPVHLGCTTDDVAELVKTFGHATIVQPHSWRIPLLVAFITFKDQEAADKIVEASFTGQGISINGERVWATYSTRKPKTENKGGFTEEVQLSV